MNRKQLQELLDKYPEDMEVKICQRLSIGGYEIMGMREENITDHADDDTLDDEEGFIKGSKPRYIVINPPIF